jgi:recombination protein RecT
MTRRPKTNEKGQIVKRDEQKSADTQLRGLIMKMKPQIEMAVPRQIGVDRFIRTAMTAITQVPDLALCTQGTFFICLLTTAQLGLMPNMPGGVWLIPRKNNKRGGILECTAIVDYRGMCALARRSGVVSSIRGVVVHDGDDFIWEEGTEPRLIHKPDLTNPERHKKPIPWVYGTARIAGDDTPHFVVLSHAEVELRRRASPGSGSSYSPWKNWWKEMAQKTAVRQVLKLAPMDTEDQLSRAMALESASESQRILTEVVDAKVVEAIREHGIDPDEEPEPAPLAEPMLWAADKKPDPTTKGLTVEQIAEGYETDPETGEVIPPKEQA